LRRGYTGRANQRILRGLRRDLAKLRIFADLKNLAAHCQNRTTFAPNLTKKIFAKRSGKRAETLKELQALARGCE
jgi:hypothetical protein